MTFHRLIRFEDQHGTIRYGNVGSPLDSSELEKLQGSRVEVVEGDIDHGFQTTGVTATLKKLLCPLPSTPIFVCTALNYPLHLKEGGIANVPRLPVTFNKPSDALAGPFDEIPVAKLLQPELDYETELTVVIGKDGKDISESEALDYVLGYTVGNDVSARNVQMPEFGGGQIGWAKSRDGFGPIGPCIVAPRLMPDPQTLSLTTTVDGVQRQNFTSADMIWNVRQLIAHASRGRTLRKGTLLMTGTGGGVALFVQPKGSAFIKDGTTCECSIEGIGTLTNTFRFE